LNVALVVNMEKEEARKVCRKVLDWLETRQVKAVVSPEVGRELGRDDLALAPRKWPDDLRFVMVFGGDGTLLNAATTVVPPGVPILGVNTGGLGFLTEVEVSDLFSVLPEILEGNHLVEERLMLEAALKREGREIGRYLALNDVVVTKGPLARLVRFKVYVDGVYLDTYLADGLIISTPTGSTAYSLSAGGPIVNPNVKVLIVTPICPHTLYSRSVVVSGKETVSVRLGEYTGAVMLTLDGQRGYRLESSDEIVVRQATRVAHLIRKKDWSFYRVLRHKLREGESFER